MRDYWLSVFLPLPGGCTLVHVYRLQHAETLEWTRAHADELARRMHGDRYCALMVSTTDPA